MNKKDSIIQSALELLVENGVHASPMSAIAKHAKTGMGTIYNYFPNKEVLINAIYVHIKLEEETIIHSAEDGIPIKAEFETYYLGVINFYMQHPLYFKFMNQFQASQIITPESKQQGYDVIEPVMIMLRRGQKEGIIKPQEAMDLLRFLGGTTLHFLAYHLERKESIDKQYIQDQLKMVWDAIRV